MFTDLFFKNKNIFNNFIIRNNPPLVSKSESDCIFSLPNLSIQ